MIYIVRNNREFGPYTYERVRELVAKGNVLRQDAVIDTEFPAESGGPACVRDLMRARHDVVTVPQAGLATQLRSMGSKILFSRDVFNWSKIKEDTRLLLLGLVGFAPFLLIFSPFDLSWAFNGYLVYYAISLYFSFVWALFFYYLFKTKQVDRGKTINLFFAVQLLIVGIYGLGLNGLNIFYVFIESGSVVNRLLGFVLGVGVTEELVKALPLFYMATRSKAPLIPQTMVFYGLICGISFGVFEGVEYQRSVNTQLGNHSLEFLMNIARVTSLPFFHAICTALAGYFISFAVLRPRYRAMLYTMAILMPAVIHGCYDTFANGLLGLVIAFTALLVLNYYLKNDTNVQRTLGE